MARYALIKNSVVENVVNWNGLTSVWTPPPSVTVVQTTSGMVGDTWNGTIFIEPAPPTPIDLSDIDNLDRTFRAVGLLMRDYCNSLLSGTYTFKSVANLKTDFAAKYNQLAT